MSIIHERREPEVIDLLSDDDSDSEDAGEITPAAGATPDAPLELDDNGGLTPITDGSFFDALASPEQEAAGPSRGRLGGQILRIDGEDVFIPDEDDTPPARPVAEHDHELAMALGEEPYTVDTCLQQVLSIFPDVHHDHVCKLYNDYETSADRRSVPGATRLDNIVDKLLSGGYPKADKGKGKQVDKKRKREDSIDDGDLKKWERKDREKVPNFLAGSMKAMLKAEYPEATMKCISDTLATQKHFFQAYIALANMRDNVDGRTPGFGRGRPSTNEHLANASTVAINAAWPPLEEELVAARKKVEIIRAQRTIEDAKKKAEQENLQRAMERGETAECSACFDDLPMNRQIHCDGPVAHFTCYSCAETYVKSEVGESRCRVVCTAGCGAAFAPDQINQLEDKQLLEKLAQLQQEKDIRDAGLDDLEECPFCDYKAILPPIEENFEFHCANPACEKVSCRRCKAISHTPISCDQHAKDNKINSRHKVEEAMTAALIRSCNKCKKQFIKEYGCNKMTCPSCSNLQCYVCSQTITNYDHFHGEGMPPGRTVGGAQPKKCPLYDNVEERHEREVKEAEAAARAQVAAENPDVSMEDLEIKVSDAVKKSTEERIRRAGPAGGGGGGFGMHLPMGGAFRAFHALVGDAMGGDFDAEEDDEALIGAAAQARRIDDLRARQEQRLRMLRDRMQRERQHADARYVFDNTLAHYIPHRDEESARLAPFASLWMSDTHADPLPVAIRRQHILQRQAAALPPPLAPMPLGRHAAPHPVQPPAMQGYIPVYGFPPPALEPPPEFPHGYRHINQAPIPRRDVAQPAQPLPHPRFDWLGGAAPQPFPPPPIQQNANILPAREAVADAQAGIDRRQQRRDFQQLEQLRRDHDMHIRQRDLLRQLDGGRPRREGGH